MAYIGNFDANTVAPATEFQALPSGEYLMAVTESEMKETKGGTGQYLQMTFTVLQAAIQDHLNRKVFVRLNLINANQTAVDIAQRELSAICHATGVLKLQDSIQLHDLPLNCKVVHLPAKGEFSESNKISKYSPASEYGKGKAGVSAARPATGPQPPRPMALTPSAAAPQLNPPPFAAPAPVVAAAASAAANRPAPWRTAAAA
jgi:hypothetical protein